MKKQHLYTKDNLVLFLNKKVYCNNLIFSKSLEKLKRDLSFYKLWTYTRLNTAKQKTVYLDRFFKKYQDKFEQFDNE